MRPAVATTPAWSRAILLAATGLFAIAYTQFPLYYETQNQYFFHGLVRAGVGLLGEDWLAGTRDPWPLFSGLVTLTHRLHPGLFYAYFAVLLAAYAYSMLGIVSATRLLDGTPAASLAFVAGLAALHSPAVGALSAALVGFSIGGQLMTGVALQDILGRMLQPATFGVLLLLSIAWFLRRRRYEAVAAAAVAAMVHPTYILTAGVLTLSYMIVTLLRGEGARSAGALGLVALVLALPALAYVATTFRPTSAALTAEARAILVHFRFPHHAFPERWLGPMVGIKLAVTALAIYLVRRTELSVVLATLLTAAVGLTLFQVAAGSDALALLFPWRLSVLFVPIATATVLARGLGRLWGAGRSSTARAIAAASLIVLTGLAVAGAAETRYRFTMARMGPRAALAEHVRATATPGTVYLIPPYWDTFRLRSGAPVFADWDFIPYNDVAVVEWHARFQMATALYSARGEARCQQLARMRGTYRLTHVVLRDADGAPCAPWQETFRAADQRLYVLR